jgi:hypothetical protein
MSAPTQTLKESRPRVLNHIARRWQEAAVALFIFGFFLYFCAHALRVRFALDEMMNMYWYWKPSLWKLGWSMVTFSNSVIRPMGAVYYLVLFKIFGFHPLPYNVFRLAVLVFNALIFFWLAARISGSRVAAAIATFVVAYHGDIGNIAYVGSFIYDAFCGGFYFCALLYYVRCRSLYGRLNWSGSCAFLGLYICALNSKEMAVSLPVVIFAYELLYHAPKTWKIDGVRRWLADAGPMLASIAITMIFIAVKTWGAGSLMNAEGFRPVYTWARFIETNTRYLNEIFYTERFSVTLVILAWAALLYAGLRNWDRRLLLLWVWVMVTPLPIAFIPGRGGACLYIIAAGWALVVGILTEALARRIAREPVFARLPSEVVVTCLLLVGVLLYGYETEWFHNFREPGYLQSGDKTWSLIQQFRELPTRPAPGSRIVFLNDDFPGCDALFVASLWWNDHSLGIKVLDQRNPTRKDRCNDGHHVSEQELSAMDYVFDFPDGRLKQLKPLN